MRYRVRNEHDDELSEPLAVEDAVWKLAADSGYEISRSEAGLVIRDMDAREIASAASYEALAEALRNRWPDDFIAESPA
jgi:hypothetical protein